MKNKLKSNVLSVRIDDQTRDRLSKMKVDIPAFIRGMLQDAIKDPVCPVCNKPIEKEKP